MWQYGDPHKYASCDGFIDLTSYVQDGGQDVISRPFAAR